MVDDPPDNAPRPGARLVMDAPSLLHWDEPDAGCVACGEPYVTVADHRCGSCLDAGVEFCPMCLTSIKSIIDREIQRRMREAAHDVNDVWVQGGYLTKVTTRLQIDANRATALSRWVA